MFFLSTFLKCLSIVWLVFIHARSQSLILLLILWRLIYVLSQVLCFLYLPPIFSLKQFYYHAVAWFWVGLCFHFIQAYGHISSCTFSLIVLITFEIFSIIWFSNLASVPFTACFYHKNYIYRNFPLCPCVFWYLLYFLSSTFYASVFLVFLDIYPFVRCVNLLLNTFIAFLF